MINTIYRLVAPRRFEIAFEDKKINSTRVIEVPAYLNFVKIIDYIFNILNKNIQTNLFIYLQCRYEILPRHP